MGIRFLCPNGHKLNVKADLAGKRALCPDCGAKLVVPTMSAVAAGRSSTTMSPPSSVDVAAGLSSIVLDEPSAMIPFAPTAPVAVDADPAPIASPPSRAWYVRPAGGGQYGPASDDDFSAWVAEGRVAADALVWRDDWTDWRLFGDGVDVAPTASPATPSPPPIPSQPDIAAGIAEPSDAGPAVADEAAAPESAHSERRRRTKRNQIVLAILMLLALMLLAVALVVVIHRSATSESEAFQPRDKHPARIVSLERLMYARAV